ncbi:MAG: nucleotidyltransferase [Steroidobacteraceae bacterium]
MAILSRLLQCLCDADVDFVVVGGFAALLHGSTLVTRDLDVCAVLSHQDVAKLREALRDLNPTHRLTPQRLSFLTNPDPGVEVRNLYLETELGAIDILSSVLGVGDFERVRATSTEIELFGRRCRVISIDDLILAKETLGREKDLLAAKELRAIRDKTK